MFGNINPFYPYRHPITPIPIWKLNFSIIQDIASCKEVLEKYNLFACIHYDFSLHISSSTNTTNDIDILFRGNKCVSITKFSASGITPHEIKAITEEDLKNDLSCLLEKIFGQPKE